MKDISRDNLSAVFDFHEYKLLSTALFLFQYVLKNALLTNFIQSSRLEPCFQKGVHKRSFPKFTTKYWCRSLFLIKLKAQSLQLWQKDFDTGVFLWNLEKRRTPFFPEVVTQKCSVKKVFLQVLKNWLKNTCHEGLQLYWKETLAPVFSSEFCKTFRNTRFAEHLLMIFSIWWYCCPM